MKIITLKQHLWSQCCLSFLEVKCFTSHSKNHFQMHYFGYFFIFHYFSANADVVLICQFNLFPVSHVCSCWRFKWLNECQTNQESYVAM